VASGQFSITNVMDCFKRIENLSKPVRIFYLRDFDPAGETMAKAVSRKLEFYIRTRKYELDAKLVDVALTHEQCIQYRLPRTPMERSGQYKDNFELKYGEGATELDSLEGQCPGILKDVLEAAIQPYHDNDLPHEIYEFRQNEQARYDENIEGAKKLIVRENRDKIEPLVNEYNQCVRATNELAYRIRDIIGSVSFEFNPEYPGRSKRIVSDTNNPAFLLDTTRSYDEQLERYRGAGMKKQEI
jgi:hypothetical protein